jgi:hypothetical protein
MNQTINNVFWFTCILALLSGCEYTLDNTAKPARIIKTTAQMKLDIQRAIVSLKGGIAPVIADNVFMNSSQLLLEHGLSKSEYGHPYLGAHELDVSAFELQIRNNQCLLYYPKKNTSFHLKTVVCVVINDN